ncbi:MAG: twin-arginine translocase TatA/TatE family subunit [Proteobacteria bacterium]|nr:twin-arginine translocase TatA/TatE family subunit [Pseudomonadota bacterium]
MGSFSIWHWLVVLAVILLLFGGSGKISKLMGDTARGIKSFKKGLKEEEEEEPVVENQPQKALKSETAAPAAETTTQKDEATKS